MSHSILIYANCQGEELQMTGRFMQCMAGRLDFKWIPLHLVTERDWASTYGRDFMSDVVTVWEQVETGGMSSNRVTLHERIPKNIPIVTFPPFTATCLWPFAGNDPRVARDPERYPWPDSIGAVLSTETLPDDALFEKYLRLTAERMPDLDRRLRLDIARWKAADAIADVQLAEWVEKTFQTVSLFHASGHITAQAIGFLMKQLLNRTSILAPALARAAIGDVDILLRRHTGQDFECVPIHPLVAERLNLRFHDPQATYRWHGHQWTFRQYILHYIRWADYLP
ncbi:MAG TPA: WcbI family polysaccharide biosynthesis putative acetyltransferase [Rhodopila sp.]|nr:WcbI family polysaccharide biosynthesis putative acetyltransferase [Rhodopila sp.]